MTIKQTTIFTNGQFTLTLINKIINYKCILSVLGHPYPRLVIILSFKIALC